jgi:L-aspartate oxidase
MRTAPRPDPLPATKPAVAGFVASESANREHPICVGERETTAHDILIVGGGLAGLFCALKLAPRPVTLLVAAPLGEGSSSAWAQGGVAAAVLPGDSPELHAKDTLAAGAGIVDKDVALSVAREARARIDDLLAFGAPFDRDAAGKLAPSREAAHSARRIVRVKGDGAGAAIMAALIARVRATPSIQVVEGLVAEELIVQHGRVAGVFARDAQNRFHAFPARATILATGGIGALYALTTNPPQATGAALAMGARAGARIADAEFVQFHPTAIDIGRDPAPLATEALRGEGAVLVNRAGKRFMPALHKDAELAPRDIVARGVFAELAGGRGAFLDATQAVGAAFPEKFPNVAAACLEAGVDPARQPIPVAPAEHYHMGGLWTDARGRTSLPGLWAVGEAGSTGLHGGNRLASNSLLEAVVFAARAADDVGAALPALPAPEAPPEAPPAVALDPAGAREIREIMQRHVGVLRQAAGLRAALIRLLALRDQAIGRGDLDLRNRAEAALLIAAGAYARRESRGGHFRTDHPQADPAQAKRSFITLDEALALSREIVDEKKSHALARS